MGKKIILNPIEDYIYISEAWSTQGGSFVSALGSALRHADINNRKKILSTFDNYVKDYSARVLKRKKQYLNNN